MLKTVLTFFALGACSAPLAAQTPSDARNPLLRHYRTGETLVYRIKGVNENWHYEIQADGIVKEDSAGAYFEEYRWSNMLSDNQPDVLSPASAEFRQRISLDPNFILKPPNLAQVDPKLIGPVTDLMTFYVDLWLAVKTGQLVHAGDHLYVKNGTPSSWADGAHVLKGESAVDFDITLKALDHADNSATLAVRHVPPEKSQIRMPAAWMEKPVAETPNNWVMVSKTPDGKYIAGVGEETFDVEMKVRLSDGRILTGSMNNLVKTVMRQCEDQALTKCSDPMPHPISRQVEISLQR
ncbi:MAG TPA: hypothetical protein VLV88_10870 [Terriglobales bacterium]|nr:hypothetical protein [Terriglobales bacterium]